MSGRCKKRIGSSFIEQLQRLSPLQNTDKRMLKESRDRLVFHVVRSAKVYRLARPILKPEHYDLPDEKPHQLILRLLYKLVDSGDFPPGAVSFVALRDAIMNELSGLPDRDLKEPWIEDLLAEPDDHTDEPGLLWRCYHEPADRLDERAGVVLLRRFVRERSYDALATFVSSLHSRTPSQFPRELADLQTLDRRLAALGAGRSSLLASMDAIITSLESGWGREMVGLKTGLKPLDQRLGGLQKLSILGAPAGIGKTALMIQLAVGVARRHGVNDAVVIFISLDMSKDVIHARLVSHLSGLDYKIVTQGSLALRGKASGVDAMSEPDWEAFEKGLIRLEDEGIARRFYILDRKDIGASLTADDLKAIIDDCKAESGCSRAAVFVDYLQILPGPPPSPTERWSPAKEVDKLDAAQELITATGKSAKASVTSNHAGPAMTMAGPGHHHRLRARLGTPWCTPRPRRSARTGRSSWRPWRASHPASSRA